MRFLARSLTGLLLTLITLALIGTAALRLTGTFAPDEAADAPRRAQERVHAVEVVRLTPQTFAPRLIAHGEIVSARRLELRPARAGLLADLSPDFRDGGAVTAGDLLFRLDPAEAEAELERADIALLEAQTETRLASAAVAVAERDLDAAEAQRALRQAALTRTEGLRARGAATEAAVETAALAAAAADQAAISREQALAAAEGRQAAAAVALSRARLARREAARDLAETEVRAPFDGLLTETAATPGRRVAAGERLGVLIDPAAFEAVVEVSTADYVRLLDPLGALPERPAVVALDLGTARARTPGRLIRAGASAAQGRTGRVLFVALDAPGPLREGDFVTVEIEEPALHDVAVIPAAAAAEDRVLVIGPDDRLVERPVTVLRRLGADLVVSRAPFGEPMVLRRIPTLGPGTRARPVLRDAPGQGERAGAEPLAALTTGADDLIPLDADRRAHLSALVDADPALAPERKADLLTRLAAPEVPRSLVEGIEGATAAAPPSGG